MYFLGNHYIQKINNSHSRSPRSDCIPEEIELTFTCLEDMVK